MKLCCSLFLFPCSPSPLKNPSLETESGRVYLCNPNKALSSCRVPCEYHSAAAGMTLGWTGDGKGRRGYVKVCSYCMATNATPCYSFEEIPGSLTAPCNRARGLDPDPWQIRAAVPHYLAADPARCWANPSIAKARYGLVCSHTFPQPDLGMLSSSQLLQGSLLLPIVLML